jgi:hypothetical protein
MIKLKKGSQAAKDFMAKLRAKRKGVKKKVSKISGEKYFIEFLNKNKNFKKDKKYFKTEEQAKKWAIKNLGKFNPDYIKSERIENLKNLHKISGNPRRETQHKDTKSHNVNIRVLSGVDGKKLFLENLKIIEINIKGAKHWLDVAKKYYKDTKEVNNALSISKYKLQTAANNIIEFIQKFNFNK